MIVELDLWLTFNFNFFFFGLGGLYQVIELSKNAKLPIIAICNEEHS